MKPILQPLDNGLNISLITAPDFNIDQCQFTTHQPVTFVWQTTKDSPPVSEYAVGPPQPIDALICRGTCISTYDRALLQWLLCGDQMLSVAVLK
ncbi:hypothetical protein MMYC01_207121 [Madurella mycetomatis]|uniref:Uncharacterized protein n=1 Tax=Madurella mycetomatis TaxID=100816 RepID=A0A175VX44_9PEZI|nr:hypothetical protein MMYC01_207121 [Madurella mycetomatis]